ncbi:MAG: hypothetical protein F8N37_06700 [Telmatospirillum sp.]|nr:hypothetical protein [Telmatospirillum sp.]
MSRLRDLPDDLYVPLSTEPWPRTGRPPKHDLSTWTVSDDWPEHVRYFSKPTFRRRAASINHSVAAVPEGKANS